MPAQGTWVTDNSAAQAGTMSAHPPTLGPNATASMTYSCDGVSHSQMSFWYRGDPSTGQSLNFYVDDVLYQTYGTTPNLGWTEVILTVATGMHT
jgi:hypothetical protein